MRLRLERRASPAGEMLIVTDEAGAMRALDFAEYEARLHRLLKRHYGDVALEEGKAPPAIGDALDAYFERVAVATAGTPFQRQVWAALRTIPAGATMSYGELAASIGRASASRAVGLANGANPVAVVVPCHRVIGADGSLTGYGGGLPRKRWLLDHERRHARGEVRPQPRPARAAEDRAMAQS